MPDPLYQPINRLQEMALGERPQERLEKLGPAALSDSELLAILLRSGTRGIDVLTLSARLIAEARSLGGLIRYSEKEFRGTKGIGRVKALQLVAMMEISRRVMSHAPEEPVLNRADVVYARFRPVVAGLTVEKFWVLCLNRKNRLIKQVEITSGTATSAHAHPREVFRPAIREAASAVICVHNHPSGDPAPSAADLQVTRQLREAAKSIEITFLDHVVVGQTERDPAGRGYYSFAEAGLM